MRYSVSLAKGLVVNVCAHPGLPNLLGFGRGEIDITPRESVDYTTHQIGALRGIGKRRGMGCWL